MNSLFYTGQLAFTDEEAVNYSANVLAADPDVVLYMLGTNDVWWGTLAENAVGSSWPSTAFDTYKNSIGPVFNQFAGFTNSRGRHPTVFVASVLPFDLEKNQARWNTTSNSGALDRIENWYNPWLRDRAALHGFTYVDAWTAIQQDADWKAKYMAADDGLHLSSQGSLWVATQFAQSLSGPFAVVWTGTVNGTWDSHATANFSGSPAGTFRDGDSVSFNDAGTRTSIEIVAGGVAPNSLDFSNTAAKEYSLSGGPIKGATGLTVSGGGHVTLSNANTYSGTTTIGAGTLTLTGSAATNHVIVGVDGTLALSTPGAVSALGPNVSITNDGILP